MIDSEFEHDPKVFRAQGRIATSRDRSIVGWVILVSIFVLVAAGASIFAFRPEWIESGQYSAEAARNGAPSQDNQIAPDFSALYQKYNMTPLTGAATRDRNLTALLAILEKEPCNKRTIFEASVAFEKSGAMREAASLLEGFSSVCPDSDGEIYHASELYYLLGDYNTAVKLSTDVLEQMPDARDVYFLRAKAEQGLKHEAAAVEDFASVIRFAGDTKTLVSEVFTRMADGYEKLGQPCEAIATLQTYIALDSQNRSTPPLLRRISALAAEGNCALAYAKGVATIPRRSNGLSMIKVQVNGVEGTFIVDTGATFMTLSRRFAERTKPRMLATAAVQMQTANGDVAATLTSLDSVKLAGLSASAVPAIVASKSLGDNIDGLLGMSFLSRFTVILDDHEMQLRAKTLKD